MIKYLTGILVILLCSIQANGSIVLGRGNFVLGRNVVVYNGNSNNVVGDNNIVINGNHNRITGKNNVMAESVRTRL